MGENIGRILSADELAARGLVIPEGVSVLTNEVVLQSPAEQTEYTEMEPEDFDGDAVLQLAAWRTGMRVVRMPDISGTPEHRRKVQAAWALARHALRESQP